MSLKDEHSYLRIDDHPILGKDYRDTWVNIFFDGKKLKAIKGETIAASLSANGIYKFRTTSRFKKPRGIFCGIGRCTDCVMIVDGIPGVRTCVTAVEEGMKIFTQVGPGRWGDEER